MIHTYLSRLFIFSWTGPDSPNSDLSHGRPLDLNLKLIHLAWHPTTHMIACGAVNSLYLYHA